MAKKKAVRRENGRGTVEKTNSKKNPFKAKVPVGTKIDKNGKTQTVYKTHGSFPTREEESRTVTFRLRERAFSVWQNGWQMPEGDYTICVGGNSQDLPLQISVYREGTNVFITETDQNTWYDICLGLPTQQDLESVMGREYKPQELVKGQFTMDNTVEEMKEYSLIMKIMYKAVEATIAKGFGGKKDYENPEFRMLMASSAGSPLRSMQISGGMKGGIMQGLLEMANGHFLRGIFKMIKG